MHDLHGAIDPHVHAAPEHIARKLDYLDLAREAHDAGMAGLVLKSHTSLSADRVQIARKVVPGIRIWGGLALNRWCGGLNPAAVENAIAYGASEIWLPTIDAANDHRYFGKTGPTVAIEDGQDLRDIFDLIAKYDLILGTGHASVEEICKVVRIARAHSVKKILITHVEAPFIALPLHLQKEFAQQGCLLERSWVFTTPALGRLLAPESILADIKTIGYESTVLASDMGQFTNPSPVEGFRDYLNACREAEFQATQIQRMAADNIAAWLS
jgi:hypothetical protein